MAKIIGNHALSHYNTMDRSAYKEAISLEEQEMKRSITAIMIICILAITLVGCGNSNNNVISGNEVVPSNAHNAAAAPTVKGLVIDTYVQGENLHSITDEKSIKVAYDIYCKYAEEKGCQKESPDNTKQLFTLTFSMSDESKHVVDFYQEASGKYYMDKKNNTGQSVEKTVCISEEAFNEIKYLLK